MKISYNWLKDYVSTDIDVNEMSKILTDIGLEVEGLETVEAVPGGLKGLVVGEVKSVSPHPAADRLQLTTVDIGEVELLPIVCGAPNVAVGQKVIVATVGTILYLKDGESFKIKRSKIRGELSVGMICAEDEIGMGDDHDGIMVLDSQAEVGMEAANYFQLEDDIVIEIGLTPNRADAASHYGVARDLAAALNFETQKAKLNKPSIKAFKVHSNDLPIQVSVESADACPRYSGLSISGIEVKDSPDWLQQRLKAIGVKPINNIVDVTNFILHELGQPLHAFDADKIEGGKVIVKTLKQDTAFTTLDEVERKLDHRDLMICNEKEGMCIAGVFGGIKSGVTEQTKAIFLESAYFNPVSIRKTAKRHGLNTDASFRYERGTDPNVTVYALKRAALLIQEVAGGKVSSDVIDLYPEPIGPFSVDLRYEACDRLIGQKIERDVIKRILEELEIIIVKETSEGLQLRVPPFKVDVQREVDIIEEILRIYGYNQILMPAQMRTSLSNAKKTDPEQLVAIVSNQLVASGFQEIFTNSLTNPSYYQEQDTLVRMLNPLSSELEVMRKSLLFGGLEAVAHNKNRQREDLKFFEFGKVYEKAERGYLEQRRLGIWMSGNRQKESWEGKREAINFYDIKTAAWRIIQRLGLDAKAEVSENISAPWEYGLTYHYGPKVLLQVGEISTALLKKMGIKDSLFYAEINWDVVLKKVTGEKVTFQALSKYPSVRRDLALLIDEKVSFKAIEDLAHQVERKLLREINLFDVYKGKNLPAGKKSYAASFTFRDDQKTLTDKHIDKVMERLINALQKELGATLR